MTAAKTKFTTKHLVIAALFSAVAFVAMLLVHIKLVPAASFLTYDPKDAVIAIGGLVLGPIPALLITIVTSVIEMLTVSESGIYGCIMNIVSTSAFAFTVAAIYQAMKSLKGAIIGLISGVVVVTLVMALWNYIITPIYMGVDRSVVAGMLGTVFIPFNALKGVINASLTYMLYRPVVSALRSAKLLPKSSNSNTKIQIVPLVVAAVALLTGVLMALSTNGII